MPLDLAKLSVEEIRRRLDAEPLTPRLLGKLRRDPRQGVQRLGAVLARRHAREREEHQRLDAMLNFERVLWRSGLRHVAGVDEVGMGPLAGPVVAAAVVFPPGTRLAGVDDSKRLDRETRARLEGEIRAVATGIGLGVAEVEEIDRVNIYRAGLLAMRRAVLALPVRPEHLLVDARSIPDLDVPQNPFQKGDGIDFSIAAASIVAKTHRDRLMVELDALHPGYGLARHKGYATAEHQEAIRRLGPSPLHRRSFAFLRELRGEYCGLFYELKARLGRCGGSGELQELEEELRARQEELAEPEQRKLRLLLLRRWRVGRTRPAAASPQRR